jgi:hypothetical protein
VKIQTQAGPLTIARVTSADCGALMTILRESADWLSARGIPQWIDVSPRQ